MPRKRLLALLLLLPLGACGTQTIDTDDIEGQIAQRVEQAVGASVDVDCPDDAKAEKGETFSCELDAEDDTKATAKVRVTSVDEDAKEPVKTDFNVPVVPVKAVEQDAAKQLRSQVGPITVDCPTLVPAGTEIKADCPITAPADAKGVVVRVSGSPDALRYETVRPGG